MTFRAFYFAWLAMSIGFLGAIAFKPDDGAVVQSEPLWTLFGITAYLGAIALYVIAAIILVGLILTGVRRVCRSGVTSPP